MDALNAYQQVIDNLVYHALLTICKSIHSQSPKTNICILDIISSKEAIEWAQMDEIVELCAATYGVSVQKVIQDYSDNLSTVMVKHLSDYM